MQRNVQQHPARTLNHLKSELLQRGMHKALAHPSKTAARLLTTDAGVHLLHICVVISELQGSFPVSSLYLLQLLPVQSSVSCMRSRTHKVTA